MENLSKELLQKAIDSILHGSTKLVTTTDNYGNPVTNEIIIGDLRQPLVQKLAQELVKSDAFKQAVEKAVTSEVIEAIKKSIVTNTRYQDLPYNVQEKVKNEMLENYQGIKVQKYKVVLEVLENTD